MSPFSTAEKNALLDDWATRALWVSGHSAWPGNAGANELATPREAATWAAASGGAISLSNTPGIAIPAGATIAFLGLWDDEFAGVFRGWAARGGGIALPFETTASDDVFRADQHPYSNGDTVVFVDTEGAVLPTPVTEGTIYYVRDVNTDTFKISATSGGAVIPITVDGAGFVQKILPQLYTTAGTETINALTFDLSR